jgi:hypothetical protein
MSAMGHWDRWGDGFQHNHAAPSVAVVVMIDSQVMNWRRPTFTVSSWRGRASRCGQEYRRYTVTHIDKPFNEPVPKMTVHENAVNKNRRWPRSRLSVSDVSDVRRDPFVVIKQGRPRFVRSF